MTYQQRATPRRDENEGPVIEALEAAGCVVKKMGSKGMPDLVILVPARGRKPAFLAMVEVKGPKGKLRPEQARFFELVRGKDVPIYVVRTPSEALKVIGLDDEDEA